MFGNPTPAIIPSKPIIVEKYAVVDIELETKLSLELKILICSEVNNDDEFQIGLAKLSSFTGIITPLDCCMPKIKLS